MSPQTTVAWALLLNLGVATAAWAGPLDEGLDLLEQWQLEDARALSERYLLEAPDEPRAWLLAGAVQHQRGEHLAALRLLEAAAMREVVAPHGLQALVEASARYASAFATRETPHFRIRYLNKDEIVAFYAEQVLETAYQNIAGDLEFLPAERGEKIVVEIYPDARGLAGATGLTLGEIETSGTIAVCKFHRLMITSPLATANGYDWANTLAHEFAHLVISKKAKNTIPIWLHEGIAKYYESRLSGGLGEALGAHAEKLLAKAVQTKKFVTFAQMHPSMAKLPSQEEAALAYAEVFTVIEYLVGRFGKASVPKLLTLAATGVDVEAALQRVYGMRLPALEVAWHKYLQTRHFRDIPGAAPRRIKLVANEKEAQTEAPLETMDDKVTHDLARLGELLQLRGHHTAAVVEYEKAYARSGVRYASLINKLARAYVAVGRAQDATRLTDKLLLAQPDDTDALLLAGRIALESKQDAVAAKRFEAVTLINPFNPEIHVALAKIYGAAGQTEKAARAQRFAELALTPRPTRTYEVPAQSPGQAWLSLVAPHWGEVRLDGGEPLVTPWWHQPVAAGTHMVEYRTAAGVPMTQELQIAAAAERIVVLPD